MHRSTSWERKVTYGAVGGTQAPDLMSFPPPGFRPLERRARIGHGDARWEHAWQTVMTWGIQRNSGMRVLVDESPAEVTDGTYVAVTRDEDGVAIPSELAPRDEIVYGPAGHPFIAPGDTATLVIPFWPFNVTAPCRVIYVIDEPNRKGFAYGTLPGHPECGEEAFLAEQTEDGSVWLTIRAFSRPSTWYWWAVYPALRFAQELLTRRYLRSLSDPLD